MKAYKHLVRHALGLGYVISVHHGKDWHILKSTDTEAIDAAIESSEGEALIRFGNAQEDDLAHAVVNPRKLGDAETLVGLSNDEWLNEWFEIYQPALNAFKPLKEHQLDTIYQWANKRSNEQLQLNNQSLAKAFLAVCLAIGDLMQDTEDSILIDNLTKSRDLIGWSILDLMKVERLFQ